MAHIDPLLERNKHFAAKASAARDGASIIAKHPVYVITCLDPAPTRRRSSSSGWGTRW
jgi:hypothetical protein